MARSQREYEHDLPDGLDLDGEDKDYSVLLAEADKTRADAAMKLQAYRVARETEERVARVNAMLRRSLGVDQ